MTNLSDFLKVKKVRCVKTCGGCLTAGKEYSVLDIRMEIKVKDDEDEDCYWESDRFEPVLDLDQAETPLRNIELTPEFKVGDKVYIPNIKNLCTIRNDEKVITSDGQYYCNLSDSHDLCFVLATQENYEMLCKLYPHIEFERPPTQADIDNEAVDKLAQAMKSKLAKKREQGYHGWETCKHGDLVQLLINHVDKGDPIDVANFCAFLFARGEQLTESILND